MKISTLASALVLALPATVAAHGGAYRGPGDSAPPSSSGPSGAGGASTGSGGGGGGAPSSGGAARSSGGPGPSSAGPAASGGVGSAATGADDTTWRTWWGFNKEPFLEVKAHVHASELAFGGDDFFLGQLDASQARDLLVPSERVIRERIVPALLAALESTASNDVVSGSLIALAKIGEVPGADGAARVEPAIARFLTDPNQEISETAALSLGILASPAAVPTLVHVLADDETGQALVGRSKVPERTRAFAGFALGILGSRTESQAVRREIVAALAREGRGGARDDVPVAAVTAMGLVPLAAADDPLQGFDDPTLGLRGQVRWLAQRWTDEHASLRVRAHAPSALARLILASGTRDEALRGEVVDLLIAGARAGSDLPRELVQSCALALGELGDCDGDALDARLRAALLALRDDATDPLTRSFARISLGRVAGRPGENEPDAGLPEVRRALLRDLDQGSSLVRPWAALALALGQRERAEGGAAIDASVAKALRDALEGARSTEDVGALAIALGILGDRESTSLLLDRLVEMGDPDTRGYLATALGLVGAREAIGPIQEIVRGARYRPELLRSAAIGLGLLGDKGLVPDLVTMLGAAHGLSAQASIAYGLGSIGDARSVEPLIAMLQDAEKTDLARSWAAVALGIVADPEPLPWNVPLSAGINYRANTESLYDPVGATGILDIL